MLVYRNPSLWAEVKILKLSGSWLRLSAASWCLGALKGCAHIRQRWVTSDAQFNVYCYQLRCGGGAVHHWQIRKSDQIKEIIKAWYQLGIKSESLLDRGVHLQGWLDSGVLWLCQLWPCPWCAKSHCRHSTAHFHLAWTSVITAPSGPQPSHQPAERSQRCSSAHSKLLQHLCVTAVTSGLTLSGVLPPLWPAAGPASASGSTSAPNLGSAGVGADGALSVCRARSLLSAKPCVNSLGSLGEQSWWTAGGIRGPGINHVSSCSNLSLVLFPL